MEVLMNESKREIDSKSQQYDEDNLFSSANISDRDADWLQGSVGGCMKPVIAATAPILIGTILAALFFNHCT
jgi:hypothetical protein